MPRKSRQKQPEPTPLETLKADPAITTAAEIERPVPELEPLRKAQIKTARPFVGRVASGRGRVVTSDDESYSVWAEKPLTDAEEALAVKHGFEPESPDGTLFIADKKTMRDANGDVNHVAYALTSKSMDTGRGW